MRIHLAASTRSQRGSALIMTLVFGVIVGIVLASYLSLLQSRMLVRARSFAWNTAVPVLEAGIEEAFTHLHNDSPGLTANVWLRSGPNGNRVYKKRRDFSNGSYCLMTISNANIFPYAAPVIYSQGFVPAPLGQGFISRLVRVDVTNAVVFTKAIAAKGTIDLNGQTTVDSYDSSNTNYSTGGRYDLAKRRDNGGVYTDSNANPAIDAGNGHIYGLVDTGPLGTVSTTAGGTVGDLVWSASNTGVQSNNVSHDMNVTYPDQAAPAGSGGWAVPSTGFPVAGAGFIDPLTLTHYDYKLDTVSNTVYGDLSLGGGMWITGNATLYIAGALKMTSSGANITIAPGASLKLYVNGTATFAGNDVVNSTGLAANFAFYGLTNCTSIKYTGSSDFIGTVNAPQADFTLTGGANYYGAAIVNSYISKSAGSGFHFDEALAYRGTFKMLSYSEK